MLCESAMENKFERRNGEGTAAEWEELMKIQCKITHLKEENDSLAEFEPELRLRQIYELNDGLKALSSGEFQETHR